MTRSRGFTLVEVLIALSLLGLITGMLFTAFYAVNRSWQTGCEVIDATGHSDYLMDQLSMGLRSAYSPTTGGDTYGFSFTDNGEGSEAHDIIEWTKTGPALIGEDAPFANVPHRIRLSITEPENNEPGGLTVRAWRQDLQLDDFDPEEDAAELVLSPKVIAFNCRMLDPDKTQTLDEELNWVDEWTKTNTLPTVVEITLFMQPPEASADPIESKRIIEIPLGVLSQTPSLASTQQTTNKRNNSSGSKLPNNNKPNNRPDQPPFGPSQEGGDGMRPGGGPPGGGDGMRPGGGDGMPPGGGGGMRPIGGSNSGGNGGGMFGPGK